MLKIKYKFKPAVGPHYKDGKEYGPGDIIKLRPDQAKGIMHKLEQLEPDPPEPQPEVSMVIMENADGTYNVVNEVTSEPVNDLPLTMEQARALVGDDAKVCTFEKEPMSIPGDEKVMGDAVVHDGDDDKLEDDVKVKAQHRGSGRYVIVIEGTGEIVTVQGKKYYSRRQASDIARSINEGSMTIADLKGE